MSNCFRKLISSLSNYNIIIFRVIDRLHANVTDCDLGHWKIPTSRIASAEPFGVDKKSYHDGRLSTRRSRSAAGRNRRAVRGRSFSIINGAREEKLGLGSTCPAGWEEMASSPFLQPAGNIGGLILNANFHQFSEMSEN
jgi:hypothetical protein